MTTTKTFMQSKWDFLAAARRFNETKWWTQESEPSEELHEALVELNEAYNTMIIIGKDTE